MTARVSSTPQTGTLTTTTTALYPDAVDQLDSISTATQQQQQTHRNDVDFDDFKRSTSVGLVGPDHAAANGTSGVVAELPFVPATPTKPTAGGNDKKDLATTRQQHIVTGESATPRTTSSSSATTRPSSEKRFVSPKDFELLKVIGMGAFGKVLQVRNKQTQHILAMKVISKRLLRRKSGYVENIQAERNILTKVKSPFVVTMHCSFQTREKLFIIMDFLAGGELFLRIGREGIFLEKTAAFYLAEIILALEHLHQLGILHRDLKPENILLGKDGHVCLTDFGLAKDFSDEGGFLNEDEARAQTVCGTQEYMAPEMIARQGYGRAADYWSLGCIAYEMLNGLPPFSSRDGAKELFRKIMSERVKMPTGSSAAACKLLKGLLNRDVQKRWGTAKSTMFEVGGVAGLKKAEFFKDIDWDKLAVKDIEPPAVFFVQNDEDLQYFHNEFTTMALPRSVVVMSADDFRPRRIESDAFRGFSFIQEDFTIPDRKDDDVHSYWDSVEGDGESLSECASSKAPVDGNEPNVAIDTRKRPPRNRKKKKDVAESAATTPAQSAAPTPVHSAATTPVVSAMNSRAPSEDGDTGMVVDDVNKKAFKAPTSVEQTSALGSQNQPMPQAESVQEAHALSKLTNIPVTPAKQETFNRPRNFVPVVATKKESNEWTPVKNSIALKNRDKLEPSVYNGHRKTPRSTLDKAGNGRQLPRHHPVVPSPPVHSPSRSDWRNHSTSPNNPRIIERTESKGSWPILGDPPTAPSSDWRHHNMSPRQTPKGVGRIHGDANTRAQPAFEGLTNDPPLITSSVPLPKLKGDWASRAKR